MVKVWELAAALLRPRNWKFTSSPLLRLLPSSRQFNKQLRTKRIFSFGSLVGVERIALTLVVLGAHSELVIFAFFQLGNAKLVHVRTDGVRQWLPLAGLCVHLLDLVAAAQTSSEHSKLLA